MGGIKKNDDAKILLTYIGKIQHIVDDEAASLTETIIGRGESDVSVRKI